MRTLILLITFCQREFWLWHRASCTRNPKNNPAPLTRTARNQLSLPAAFS
jgi:hypothetical protein